MSVLLQLLSEHDWFMESSLWQYRRFYHRASSWGRFCGDPVPNRDLNFTYRWCAWLIWWFRLFFYHLPVRIAVLPGDLPQHDFHHRYPCPSDSIFYKALTTNAQNISYEYS